MKKYQEPALEFYAVENTDVLNSSSEVGPQNLGGSDWGCEDVL